jgi:hypothetical protein
LLGANYVIDVQTRYLIGVPTPQYGAPRLRDIEHVDLSFIAAFRQPASFDTPDQELWRLYSRRAAVDNKPVEILVGYAEKAPWKLIDTPASRFPEIDEKLIAQANQIADSIRSSGFESSKSTSTLSADGFDVVDAVTGELLNWHPWLPMFLPQSVALPQSGNWPTLIDQQLCLVITAANDRLRVTSVVALGYWWIFLIVPFAGFCSGFVVARWASQRFLRNYLAFADVQLSTISEALHTGEGQAVEFKRGLSDVSGKSGGPERELLESIASFANTNDGVILIGVDDDGNVRGLPPSYRQRDRFDQKIHQMVRSHIKPAPPIQIGFESVQGGNVAKISVARGDEPVYLLNGVIYIRTGSLDMPAQPADIARLFTEHGA